MKNKKKTKLQAKATYAIITVIKYKSKIDKQQFTISMVRMTLLSLPLLWLPPPLLLLLLLLLFSFFQTISPIAWLQSTNTEHSTFKIFIRNKRKSRQHLFIRFFFFCYCYFEFFFFMSHIFSSCCTVHTKVMGQSFLGSVVCSAYLTPTSLYCKQNRCTFLMWSTVRAKYRNRIRAFNAEFQPFHHFLLYIMCACCLCMQNEIIRKLLLRSFLFTKTEMILFQIFLYIYGMYSANVCM